MGRLRLPFALFYSAIVVLALAWGRPWFKNSFGIESEAWYELCLLIGLGAGYALFKPKTVLVLVAAWSLAAAVVIIVLRVSAADPLNVIGGVLILILPTILPYLWHIGHFDLHRDVQKKKETH
jgi:hypothetical protein